LALLENRASERIPIIVALLAAAEIEEIIEAFEYGAKGVVLKESLPREWGTRIQSLIAGQY